MTDVTAGWRAWNFVTGDFYCDGRVFLQTLGISTFWDKNDLLLHRAAHHLQIVHALHMP